VHHRPPRPAAFSLLETSIAVAVLGIGLIMVAAIFPVALSQHRDSVEQAAVTEFIPRVGALLRARMNPDQLWVPPGLPLGEDSPWYLLPIVNIAAGANNLTPGATNWDELLQPGTAPADPRYVDLANSSPFYANPLVFSGLDILTDRLAPFTTNNRYSPFTDNELMDAPNRLTWFGFYRRRSTGQVNYSIAVCKQRRGLRYAEQDLLAANPFAQPSVRRVDRRLPVPWRLVVGWLGGKRLANNPMAGAEGLGLLAPEAGRIMIRDAANDTGVRVAPGLSGRVLTVGTRVTDNIIEVLEDLPELAAQAPYDFSAGTGTTLELWLFPPAFEDGNALQDSPALAWRTNL
jgi:type II secretory pathway pseudopilin PulG